MKGALAEVKSIESARTRRANDRLQKYKHPVFKIPVHAGELWTARQRQMHPLHYAVSYRASFKPELPDFFMGRYLRGPGAVVLDPFGGRGTTILQANMLGHRGIHNDINPVSLFLASARGSIPPLAELIERTRSLDLRRRKFRLSKRDKEKLLPFFHPDTLQEILNLRALLLAPENSDDHALRYIGLTALSRLYGHSDGFFSVYTFPQISIMPEAQKRNNRNRNQEPEYKNIQDRIIRKMKRDLAQPLPEGFAQAAPSNQYVNHDARDIASVRGGTVDLIVTSPPFLNKVNYLEDNWMRAWFLGLDTEADVTMTADPREWSLFMRDCIREFGRLLKKGGRAVIEVGEVVSGGSVKNLEELMLEHLPMKVRGGALRGEELFLNQQNFTKLANCWDVKNNKLGTNTNRCLVIIKE